MQQNIKLGRNNDPRGLVLDHLINRNHLNGTDGECVVWSWTETRKSEFRTKNHQ